MNVDRLVGQSLGQYQLRELLGVGGMGAVYRGFQQSLNREVAIKVIFARVGQERDYEDRFAREARTAAALEHPHIVPVYDFGMHQGVSYVVMRLLSGGSLAERIEHSNQGDYPLPSLHEVARITSELADALQYAHNQGVIHRDIKASNVMFDHRGTVFLVDFGIAKLAGVTSGMTGSGALLGTPWFMAPEQWRGDPITPAVDQYALAILLYSMLTGKMPFEAETPYQLMHKHLHETPIPLENWRLDLPPEIAPVLERGLEKEPEARYPSVERFAQALSAAVGSSPATRSTGFFTIPLPPKPPPTDPMIFPPPPRRSRLVWAGAGGAVLAAVILAAVLLGPLLSSGVTAPTETPTITPTESPPATATAPPATVAAIMPSPLPSATFTSTPSDTATPIPIETATHTATFTPTATGTPTSTRSQTPTATQTATPAPASIAQLEATDTATPTATPVPPTETDTPTVVPTATPTFTATPLPTETPTVTPVPPTKTRIPTETPTLTPTSTATATSVPPSNTPIPTPTPTDTATVTSSPTRTDTPTLTLIPPTKTRIATTVPTEPPTATATLTPSPRPTDTTTPTRDPRITPSKTRIPTATPTLTRTPTTVLGAASTAATTAAPPTDLSASALASPTPTLCEQADVNASGAVDIFDLRALARVYGSKEGDSDYDFQYDFDSNGTINILDLRRISSQYGQTCSAE